MMQLEGKWTVDLDGWWSIFDDSLEGCTSVIVHESLNRVQFADAEGRVHIFAGEFHLISEAK